MILSDAGPIHFARLPAISLRDRVNLLRQSVKFKCVPFRGYYRCLSKANGPMSAPAYTMFWV